jgi:hypothetical protein
MAAASLQVAFKDTLNDACKAALYDRVNQPVPVLQYCSKANY